MTIKQLITKLQSFPETSTILLGSDEEFNTIFTKFEVSELESKIGNEIIIWPYSGSEQEDIF